MINVIIVKSVIVGKMLNLDDFTNYLSAF